MTSVAPRARLPAAVVAAIDESSRLNIKAGTTTELVPRRSARSTPPRKRTRAR